ncbi:DEAD/DEAH box helicase [Gloeothece verrucosa]|uniref:DEAD/DEAH box helicase domain protein n=1 Tax=Gloeothece verrucosa (strain PCC 7822) TaxID=497965 RepID=E0UNK5_GLOV7|nr:DEAD/DEAH box helicase [Gloeothece verrucosa]ADN18535.1 DEAD/DEAH box helicase domain protein [Gloeothece verrucosa PCC 7822]
MDSPIDQAALRKALNATPPTYPEWLDVGKLVYSNQHKCHGTVIGFLDRIVNIQINGKTYQVQLNSLSAPTIEITNTVDLSIIAHPTYRAIASEWSTDLSGVKIIPGNEADTSPIPDNLHPSTKRALLATGIQQFYSHQLSAWKQLTTGLSITLTTPTASGKTMAFTPYSFELALSQHKTTLLIYPLKALAADQYEKLIRLNEALPASQQLAIARCTGDIPLEVRKQYFCQGKCPDIILMSPDVLHYQLWNTSNPKMYNWQEFLNRLSLVVIDEAHSYIGSFGIHFANVTRRLRLACDNTGNPTSLQWVISTATISNPLELASTLTGLPKKEITLIDRSGALTHEKTLLVLKPQAAPNFTAATMIRFLWGYGLSGLVFVNSRATAKSLFSHLRYQMGGYCSEIELFYGSLTAAKRTELIGKLSQKRIKILITTTALEAGVDLPSLDFVIIRGATSLNSLWQRAGRTGRSAPGLIVFIPDGSNHIDYYYSSNPDRLFAPVEKIKLQPNYPPVLANHLLCAATEGGIPSQNISNYFGETSAAISAELIKQQQLFWGPNQVLVKKGFPHKNVSLRGIIDETVNLIDSDTGEVFEEMALNFAHRECHTDAIYITSEEGETVIRRCEKLDSDLLRAILKKVDLPNNRTQPIVEFEILTQFQLDSPKIISTAIVKGNLRATLWWGTISEQVHGYREFELIYAPVCTNPSCTDFKQPQKDLKKCRRCYRKLSERLTQKLIGENRFEPLITSYLAPILRLEANYALTSKIFDEAESLKKQLLHEFGDAQAIPGLLNSINEVNPVQVALHSLAHFLEKSVPLLFLASEFDVSSVVVERQLEPEKKSNAHPIIAYMFDSNHEGNGTTEAIFTDWDNCITKAYELASGCDCNDSGCPKCLTSHSCPELNVGLHKPLGLWFLERLLKK